jgi:hypothetical protein
MKLKRTIICILLSFSGLFIVKAFAMASDDITIYIGYFGWTEEQYVKKATYSWIELDDLFGGALDTYVRTYSYNNGATTQYYKARGFNVRDLLEYAGVDFSSIYSFKFVADDKWWCYFTKTDLFNTPRYYFPNMAVNEETEVIYPYDGDDIWSGACQIEPMFALESTEATKSAAGSVFDATFSPADLKTSYRFHLLFGQAEPAEAMASAALKYTNKVYITFSGTPVLSTEQTNIDLKVGSDFKMTVNVSAEDSVLDSYVKDNLLWSSNNEKVIEVDRFGNLKVKGSGEAVITASYGGSSVSVTVKVGENEAVNTGGSASQPSGEADSKPAEAAQTQAEQQTAEQEPEQTADEVQFSENSRGVYILSKELMSKPEYADWVNSILKHKLIENEGKGGLDNRREEAMDKDAVQLILLAKQGKEFLTLVSITVAGFFAFGFIFGLLRYKRRL